MDPMFLHLRKAVLRSNPTDRRLPTIGKFVGPFGKWFSDLIFFRYKVITRILTRAKINNDNSIMACVNVYRWNVGGNCNCNGESPLPKERMFTITKALNYREFPAIGKQEGVCCKLTLTLLRAQRASM